MRPLTIRAAASALSACVIAACHSAPEPQPTPLPVEQVPSPVRYTGGEQVLAAMRARYDGKWYSTLTFRQKTSRLGNDGKWNEQTWYEALRIPGRLRIDFDPVSAGNGVLYVHDSAFTIRNGKPLPPSASVNPLLVLGFDVYKESAARTASILRKEGFDLSRVHYASFEGRPMIVVGATAGDNKRPQFWVDVERLLFVRLIEPTPRDSSRLQDIRFTNYRQVGDAWISPRVEIWSEGKLVFFEEYSDIKPDAQLDDALFDPTRWNSAKHWMKP